MQISSFLNICTYNKAVPLLTMKASSSRYSSCVYFASGALARKIEKLATEAWQKVGLAPSHGYLLMMVLEEPGIQPNKLVQELFLSPSTITRLIDKLENKKLVRRVSEGKLINLFPTAKALGLQSQLKSCMHCFAEKYCHLLDSEEISALTQTLNQATDKLGK